MFLFFFYHLYTILSVELYISGKIRYKRISLKELGLPSYKKRVDREERKNRGKTERKKKQRKNRQKRKKKQEKKDKVKKQKKRKRKRRTLCMLKHQTTPQKNYVSQLSFFCLFVCLFVCLCVWLL